MFTIKHITPMGSEAMIETDEVSYTPCVEPNLIPTPNEKMWASTGTVWWRSERNAEIVPIRDGDVYVMNKNGATVAKYHLGGWYVVEPPKPA